jgi:hypothetical protein
MLCSDFRTFFLMIIMLFVELNDLLHLYVDIAIVEIAVKSGFNLGIFKESFKSLNYLNP